MAKATPYYIEIGTIKYGWRSTKDYSSKVGQAKKAEGVSGVSFGANSPKPPKVRCKLANGKTVSFFISSKVDISKLPGQSVGGSKIVSASYA